MLRGERTTRVRSPRFSRGRAGMDWERGEARLDTAGVGAGGSGKRRERRLTTCNRHGGEGWRVAALLCAVRTPVQPTCHSSSSPVRSSTAPPLAPLLAFGCGMVQVGWTTGVGRTHRQPLANRLIGDSHGALGGPGGASRRTPGALRARVAGGGHRSRGGGSLGAARARRQPARGQARAGAGPSLRGRRGRGTSEPWRRAGCPHRACDRPHECTTNPSAATTPRAQSAHK